MAIPHLRKIGRSTQLVVNDKPFLMLAGELQNSSMSSAEYMKDVWPKMKESNFNTLLGAVTWEDIEPVEGKFDFTELDRCVVDAREHGLHLILLWFGSFKNGVSTYVPGWVKQNSQRFPRAELRVKGGGFKFADVLSLFGGDDESVKADQRVFARLMAHLKEIDEFHSTVLMVQVENEVGLLGDSRDFSSAAQQAFHSKVPQDLISFLSKDYETLHPSLQKNLTFFQEKVRSSRSVLSGSWTEVFGESKQTDELFMAYHYSHYVNKVAGTGSKEYSIPLYTNVWMNYLNPDNQFPTVAGGGGEPGDYPSGGAVSNTLDIWKHNATDLAFISPDIYLTNYIKTCEDYRHNNQPLFIPEQRRDDFGARRVWVAYGTYLSLAASPFGVDTLTPEENPYTRHLGLLKKVAPFVLDAQTNPGSSMGFYFDEPGQRQIEQWHAKFGVWNITVEPSFVFGKESAGAGMIIHLDEAKFLLIGFGFRATITSSDARTKFTGILSFKEVTVDSTGKLHTLRKLNGDETRSGKFFNMPNEDPDYGGFPIAVTIPSNTMIAECKVYSL